MKLGAEPRKVAILGGLVLVAAYFLYTDLISSPSGPSEAGSRRASNRPSILEPGQPTAEEPVPVQTAVAHANAPRRSDLEFHPSFKNKGIDPGTIDPKLRLDLLAKVRSVEAGQATRNLFAYGAANPASLPPGVRD